MSVLHIAVEDNYDISELRSYIMAGHNVNATSPKGTPLTLLTAKNVTSRQDIEDYLQMARMFLRYGADVNAANALGHTPLINAVRVRNCRMVRLLLRANADVTKKDTVGNTVLHHAVVGVIPAYLEIRKARYIWKLRIFKNLIRYRCNLEEKNIAEQTPLMKAVWNQDYQIMKELLERDASVNVEDRYHKTLMQYALDQLHVEVNIVLELVRYGCPFNVGDDSSSTMVLYIRRLSDVSNKEFEEATKVFKVYVFDRKTLTRKEKREMNRMRRRRKRELSKLLKCCLKEIPQMEKDEIVPNCYVYNLALRGIYYRYVNQNHLPHEVFDKVLDKLLKGEYPVYCDFIMAGICRPYLNIKFAETCNSVEIDDIEFLSIDTLRVLATYMSHRDILNMMQACSPDYQPPEESSSSNMCSIS